MRSYRNTILSTLVFTIILLSAGATAWAHLEQSHYLKGYIGDRPAAAEIINIEGFYNGRYFYLNEKKDRYLRAECDSSGCVLKSSVWDKEKGKETWIETFEIREDTAFNWHGTYRNATGENKEVHFWPINPDSIQTNFEELEIMQAISPYEKLRFEGIKFEKGKSKKAGKKLKADWYEEPMSGIRGFRLGKGFGIEADSANRLLEKMQVEDVAYFFSCGSVGHKGETYLRTEISYANPQLVCFKKTIRSNCHGFNMDVRTEFHTLSVNEAHYLDLEEILWLGEGELPRKGSREYYQYRYNVFSKKIVAWFTEWYADDLQTENCDYLNQKYWQFPEWLLTGKGIRLIPKAIGIPAGCELKEWPLLPYAEVREYLNPDYFPKQD